MTRVFFYHGADDRLAATAALINKAFAQKRTPLLVYAPDREVAAALDRHLWVHPPTAFIPHAWADSPLAGETPIVIAERLDAIPHDERLINLSEEVPPGFARFSSLIEVVGATEEQRCAARQRARYYLDRGYEVDYVPWAGKP